MACRRDEKCSLDDRPVTGEPSVMEHEMRDITIIGGGPAGLFALFYAGMRGASAQIVDALPELGGQLAALYPEKYIFDVAGYPKVLAKDLVKSLREQAAQFQGPTHLGQRVTGLHERGGHFLLETEKASFPTKAIIIAAGIGAFSPRRLPHASAEPWYGRGIYDTVTDPQEYRNQRVVIIGGGDSAFDWATQLAGIATHVSVVHRSDRFRAHGATVSQFHADVAAGRASLHTFHELVDVIEHAEGERFSHIVLKDIKAKTTRELEADVVLPMLGFGDRAHGDLGGGRRHHLPGEAQADRVRLRRSGHRREPGGALDLPGEEDRAGPLQQHGHLRTEGRLIDWRQICERSAASLTSPATAAACSTAER
jgi:ferredoxin/flavodoxin---NADP+ reductase